MWSAIVPAIGRTDPVPTPSVANGLERALAQPRVRGQPEIVVRREVDDRAVVDRRARGLLAVEHAQRAEESLLAKLVQRRVDEGHGPD